MSQTGRARRQAAFTASIEAKEGVTTGISAHDRAHMIAVAINPRTQPTDIVSPGHLCDRGAGRRHLDPRRSHRECRGCHEIGGPHSCGCNLRNPELRRYDGADTPIWSPSPSDTISGWVRSPTFRSRSETLITRIYEGNLTGVMGEEWNLRVYSDAIENLALTKGDPAAPDSVMLRVHAGDRMTDILGGRRLIALHTAMRMIAEEKRGVVVLVSSSRRIMPPQHAMDRGMSEEHGRPVLRDYGIGAQILVDLGVRNMILLSDADHVISGLHGYGLNVIAQRPVGGRVIDEAPISPRLPVAHAGSARTRRRPNGTATGSEHG